ncbi:hypothetical protein [Sphaerisporangium fuscum]|uniref:hypothetical protein n=1 Tax=Sphaerisporangium fuscum TaxID=2835868 RepID=UPI001BDCF620|nr:hypothetical protein [Sphaerisporangium fuscum]
MFGLAAFTLVLGDGLPGLLLDALGLGARLPGLPLRGGARLTVGASLLPGGDGATLGRLGPALGVGGLGGCPGCLAF